MAPVTEPIRISLVLPAYNEESNIVKALEEAITVLSDSSFADFEVIVVNDGSQDQTETLVNQVAKRNLKIRVVNHSGNQGYGAALLTGFSASRFDYIFFTDADLQFELAEIHKLLIHRSQYPVVLGYRCPRMDSQIRLFYALGWNWLNRILFGLRVRDIDCAFKLFQKDVIEKLHIKSRGAMLSAEILIKIRRNGHEWIEVPVAHKPRNAGEATGAKLKVIIRAFLELSTLYTTELAPPWHQKIKNLFLCPFRSIVRYFSKGRFWQTLSGFVYFSLSFIGNSFSLPYKVWLISGGC